jgi:DNA-binding MarR family transcriptional regulator
MNFMTLATILGLSPQARTIYDHILKAGSISAREAMADYGITSATLARRICDIEAVGFVVYRETREHPIHKRRYTRYSIGDSESLSPMQQQEGAATAPMAA